MLRTLASLSLLTVVVTLSSTVGQSSAKEQREDEYFEYNVYCDPDAGGPGEFRNLFVDEDGNACICEKQFFYPGTNSRCNRMKPMGTPKPTTTTTTTTTTTVTTKARTTTDPSRYKYDYNKTCENNEGREFENREKQHCTCVKPFGLPWDKKNARCEREPPSTTTAQTQSTSEATTDPPPTTPNVSTTLLTTNPVPIPTTTTPGSLPIQTTLFAST